ncbi:hypothetical protein AB0B13_26605 [Streptomyces sp. NPDC042898]|uniref:hypothetical protein n=1 Tax=Streptomyces sp. NPDC042898 TaxID=3154334 RepID=UPI0033D21E40
MAGNLYVGVDYGRNNGPGEDSGSRPWTRDDPPFWANASIWLEPGITKATVGDPSFIRVRVSNRGSQIMNSVRVQAFIYPASIGVPPTFGTATKIFSAPTHIPPGAGTNDPDDAHIVRFGPWTPQPAELQGDGHMCLIANVYQSEDDVAVPDPGSAPITATEGFNPNGEQHQGQRNIILQPARQPAVSQPVKVQYTTRPEPPSSHPRQYKVMAEPFEFDGFSPDELLILSQVKEIEFTKPSTKPGTDPASGPGTDRGTDTASVFGSDYGEPVLKTSYGTERVTRATSRMSFSLKAEGIPGLDQTFERDEKMGDTVLSELEVQLDPDAPVGSLHTFDLSLNDEKDRVGSGLRVMILVTE